MPDELDAYLDPAPKPRARVKPTASHLDVLSQFAKENKLTMGSTTGGRHNVGSLHYSGNAVDIKGSGAFDDNTVKTLSQKAAERGLLLRDERTRPRRKDGSLQKVWGGPHVHLEYAGDDTQKPIQPKGELDDYLDPPTVTKPVTNKSLIPRVERQPSVGAQPSILDALNKITADTTARTAAIKPQGRGMARTSIKGLSPFAGVTGGVAGNGAPQPTQRSAGIEEALRQAAQSGVKETDRRGRIASQMTREQAAANRTGLPGLPAYNMGNMSQEEREAAITSRAAVERGQEEEAAKQAEQYARDKPEIDRLKKEYRRALKSTGALPESGQSKWTSETLAKGIAPLVNKLAGLGRATGAPGTEAAADAFRLHAEALRQAAEAEGADRNQASKFVQNVASGFIATAPELALMSAGVPAPVAFGAGAGTEAYGARRPVAPATTHGALTGLAFEIPGIGQGLTKAATEAGATGLGTAALDLAAGATPQDALSGGVTNALMRGIPAGKQALEGRRNARLDRVSTELRNQPPERDASGVRPPESTSEQGSIASEPSAQPQRFQHLQFGEIEVVPDQSGARRGRIKVAEVNNPEAIHYVKKSDLRGRGNERMIPLKPEAPTENPLDEYLEPKQSPAEQSVAILEAKLADMKSGEFPTDDPNARAAGIIDTERALERARNEAQTSQSPVQGSERQNVEPDDAQRLIDLIEQTKVKREPSDTLSTDELPARVQRDALDSLQDSKGKYIVNSDAGRWRLRDVPLAELTLEPSVASKRGFESESRKLAEAISDSGYVQPIAIGAGGIEGNHRIRAAQLLGMDTVPAYEWIANKTAQLSSSKVASPQTLNVENALGNKPESSVSPKPSAPEWVKIEARRDNPTAPESLIEQFAGRGLGGGDVPDVKMGDRYRKNGFWYREGTPNFMGGADTRVTDPRTQTNWDIEYEQSSRPSPQVETLAPKTEVREEGINATALPLEPVAQEPKVNPKTFKEAVSAGDAAPSTTSPKDASMQADREALGLPKLEQVPRVKSEEVLAEAKQKNAADPRAPDVLIEQALKGGKNFNNVETMQVNLRAVEVKNEIDRLNRELYEAKDPQVIAEKSAELDARLSEYDKISEADDLAGAEWSRAGTARKRALAEDFSLVKMVAGLKKDKRAPLTEQQLAEVKDLHARLGKAEKARDAAEERAIKAEFEATLNKVGRQRKRTETKASLDQEAVLIKQNIVAELARIKSGNIHASGLAGIDPEGRLTKELIKYVHNRAKANIGLKAEALLDEAHDLVKDLGVTRRQVAEALVGYGGTAKQRSEAQKRVTEVNAEINRLLKEEDVQAGRRTTRQEGPKAEFTKNQNRLKTLQKEKAELERRMVEGDFSEKAKREAPRYTRETLNAQKEVEKIKAEYAKMKYRATRGRGGMISDELAKAASIPKTLKSIGDISAVFRQGGFYAITHPIEGGAKPFKEMVKSFSDLGWRNVEAKIKADKDFETLKKAGVEFTGVDKQDPHLSHHEEGYLGKEYLDYVPVAKQIAGFSERTFVSFLDAQRLSMGKQMLEGLTEAQRRNPAELQAIARLINTGTGRGSLGRRGNAIAPALNIAMFSPRLLASRVQLLNNMINPVTIARMPAGARARMIKDNVKFLGATAAILTAVKAAGGKVSLDPDDSEFLKIRFGDTVYDQLTGLQQPLRYIINMSRGLSPVNSQRLQAGDYYAGESLSDMTKKFARSKLNPAVAPVVDRIAGEDFAGRKFSYAREAKDLITPLPAKDVYEGLKQGGIVGGLKSLPTFVGIGTGSYPEAAEKPTTLAEKMSRKFVRESMPPRQGREEEQIETDRQKSQLRARSRKGEDVSADIAAMGAKITERQAKGILAARNKTRLQEDFNRLGAREAVIVYSVATPEQKAELKDMLQKKSALIDTMPPDQQDEVRKRFEALGMQRGTLPRVERQERQQRTERKSREKTGYVFQ